MNFPFPQSVVNPALGSDLAGTNDLTAQMAESSGRRCLAEALVRRVLTPRGQLLDDPDYGEDLLAWLNDDVDANSIRRLASVLDAEWLKDERVIAADVVVQFVGESQVAAARSGIVTNPNPGMLGVLVISATITDGTGPFLLVISASAAGVALLEVTP